MIAQPHICLRCQLRLARRSTPSRFQCTDSKSRRSRIIPEVKREFEREPTRRPLGPPPRLSARPLGPPEYVSEHPLGKLYGFRGQKLRENRERLNVDALGEPAEVIVLRDSRLNLYNHSNVLEIDVPEPIDILAKLDEERGLVGQKEVEENINEFRPQRLEEPQTREEFNKLVTDLQTGFTVSQLSRYLQCFGRKGGENSRRNNESLLLRISPWMPGILESTEPLGNDDLRGYDLQSYTSKQRLVVRLMRECWKLELPALEDGIGQIEVELQPGDLDLLLKGSKCPISVIHSKYIVDREEMLETFRSKDANRSRNAIRITTTREKGNLIIQEIERALKGIRRVELSLGDLMPPVNEHRFHQARKWADGNFDDSVLDELSHLTNTDIRRLSKKRLVISSIDMTRDSVTSNRTDVATRLLLTSGNFSDRETHRLGCKDTLHSTARASVTYPPTEGLGWRDRLFQWTRLTAPIAKEVESQDKVVQTAKEATKDSQQPAYNPLSKDIEALETQGVVDADQQRSTLPKSTDMKKSRGYTHWSDEYFTDSSALIGIILHSCPDNPPSLNTLQKTDLISKAMHSFSTSIPNLSRILNLARLLPQKRIESVIMRFQPNPFCPSKVSSHPMGSAALSAFPSIEMRFSINSANKTLSLKAIQGVASLENSDLMLPDSPVDIRFQQKTTSRLNVLYDHLPQGIVDFLKKSNLSLTEGLQTPPSLKIPIASHLCRDPGFELLAPETPDSEVEDVEYLFAGLEIHNTMAMEFDGWQLLYTSIEAGKAGGRRGELRLRPILTGRFRSHNAVTEREFVESAFKLADAKHTGSFARNVQIQEERIARTMKTEKWKENQGQFTYFAKKVDIRPYGAREKYVETQELWRDIEDIEHQEGEEGIDEGYGYRDWMTL